MTISSASSAVDVSITFPPQWSPFQPALSLPALTAWLRREGHTVAALDANLEFYHFLLSHEVVSLLGQICENNDWSESRKRAYQRIFDCGPQLKRDLNQLRAEDEDILDKHLLFNRKLNTYLNAISDVQQQFEVSSYNFELKADSLSTDQLEAFVSSPHEIIARFADATVEKLLETSSPVVGLSCIGQDQLPFTLLFGYLVKKQRPDCLVVVGGTIFSRIIERGALPERWFKKYFDVVVFNEGEKPLSEIVSRVKDGLPVDESVLGVAVLNSDEKLVRSRPQGPLLPSEIPIPDFSDLKLDGYLSASTTLPILSSRGCYWGKCEFCHHGMVYGEKYTAYQLEKVWEDIQVLAERYGVSHFAFNDEAIPPKVFRGMGRTFDPSAESGFHFTGLIKFERYFTKDDYAGASNVGFRTIYVGLESASERVLELMKKRTSRETIVANLSHAAEANIWMHCFLFFGFPGESDDDALETYNFIMENSDIVSSFGAGSFALEHNAPIFHHMEDFGVRAKSDGGEDVNVFYDYQIDGGVGREEALNWASKLNDDAGKIPEYGGIGWIPREHLLFLMANLSRETIRAFGSQIASHSGLPPKYEMNDVFSYQSLKDCLEVSVLLNGKATQLSGNAREIFEILSENNYRIEDAFAVAKPLMETVSA